MKDLSLQHKSQFLANRERLLGISSDQINTVAVLQRERFSQNFLKLPQLADIALSKVQQWTKIRY